MKYIYSLFILLFSINFWLASVKISELDLKAIEKKFITRGLYINSYPKDSLIRPASTAIIVKPKKGKKTQAHKIGLFSFLSIFTSYILFFYL